MKLLHLVDGSGYIFRAFYAVAPLSTQQGMPTNALYGFTRMLQKLLRDVQATHVAVAFDTAAPTFRHELYAEYKANRRECPAELVPQLPFFRKIVEALGIQSLEKAGVEADDIIATLTTALQRDDTKIVIVSGDKDLTQLVNERVEVWDAMRDIHFTPSTVRDKFGVPPEQIVDYLTLVGDTSDNVPGAKGIGPKTAKLLLERFSSLEELLQDTAAIEEIKGLRGAASVRKTLESSGEMLRLSRKLVELDHQVDPYRQVQDIAEFTIRPVDPAVAGPLFHELEFPRILESLSLAAPIAAPSQRYATKNFRTVRSAEELTALAAELSKVSEFAFDTETTSLDVLGCELVGISISWKPNEAYYLPIACGESREGYHELTEVVRVLNPIFADESIKKIGLNLKFDLNVLTTHGFTVRGVAFDGMLASYVLSPDKREHGLKALAKCHLNVDMVTYEELLGDAEAITDVELERLSHYACHDAEASWCLREALDKLIGPAAPDGGASLRRIFEEIEVPLIPVLAAMERAGIKTDVHFLSQLGDEFAAELQTLEARIHELAGGEFNLNSPKQLSEVLFDRLGLPTAGLRRTQSGFSTDASVLARFADKHEIVRNILEYREIFKLKSTYVEALIRLTRPDTGRVHTSFNQAIAATGRLSSSEPNLQNIPIRNPRGRRIRQAFIAEDGYSLISADYSQIELRILAHLADDPNLIDAFRRGEDIHLSTARDIFGDIALSGTDRDRLRRIAKTINFGIIYGMSAFRLAGELEVPRRQAQEYIDNYFAKYAGVQRYFDRLAEESQRLGYVATMFGRRRYLKDIDTTGRDAGYAGRSLLNAPIQGTAAEIIKLAMIRLYDELEQFGDSARIVLQVHDELVVEARQSVLESVRAAVARAMEGAVELSVPLKADIRVGRSWGALE